MYIIWWETWHWSPWWPWWWWWWCSGGGRGGGGTGISSREVFVRRRWIITTIFVLIINIIIIVCIKLILHLSSGGDEGRSAFRQVLKIFQMNWRKPLVLKKTHHLFSEENPFVLKITHLFSGAPCQAEDVSKVNREREACLETLLD